MPELPEVETVVSRLNQVLQNKTVQTAVVYAPKSFLGDVTALSGKTITAVSRKAKLIRISFDDSTSLLVHLKMTGQLIYLDTATRVGGGHPTADWVGALPSSHTRFSCTFTDGSELFFNDQRLFGWVRHLTEIAVAVEFAKYAPDVIDAVISPEYLFSKTQRTARSIKVVLLDSTIMSGLGNIYVCDALNAARIAPLRPASSLNFEEVARLLQASKDVLHLGIKLGGATIEHFRHVDGFSGGYQTQVRVYGKEGSDCPNCSAPILKQKIAGRGTYFCAACQL